MIRIEVVFSSLFVVWTVGGISSMRRRVSTVLGLELLSEAVDGNEAASHNKEREAGDGKV